MKYLDTNVLIYAFCKNVDNEAQKRISQEILRETVSQQKLLLSEIVLYEFAFVSKKLEEDYEVIDENISFLSKYVKKADIYNEVIEFMKKTNSYKCSFDVYHIVFSNSFSCSQLITFDSGFKKFNSYSKTKIKIL